MSKQSLKHKTSVSLLITRDNKFVIQIGSDLPQMGQIWDSPGQNDWNWSLKVPDFSIWGQSDTIWMRNWTFMVITPHFHIVTSVGLITLTVQSHIWPRLDLLDLVTTPPSATANRPSVTQAWGLNLRMKSRSGADWLQMWYYNAGLFPVRFQYILAAVKKGPHCSHLGPIWPTLEPNVTSLRHTTTTDAKADFSQMCQTDFKYTNIGNKGQN